MKQYDIIFSDLDGTLIETISGGVFPKGIWDMKLRFEVLDKIKEIKPKYLLIVSNQGGIECYAMYCETNDKSDTYRKPNTGMLHSLLEKYIGDDFDYIKQKSLMIGDASGKEGQFSDTDKKTAENFGIDYLDVDDFVNTNWED